MVYVDRRAGSAELWPLLVQRQTPAELTTLEFGDCAIDGHGPQGGVLVGVERKVIRDLVQSLTTGRLSGHQIPGLTAAYPYRWLLVEGSYRADESGNLEVPGFSRRGHKGWDRLGLKVAALDGYLLTLTLRAGIYIQRTYSIHESAEWLSSLHRWWQKPWADHKAHLALHQPQVDGRMWEQPNTVQRMAACLPGIGGEKSAAVADQFASPLAMALASEAEWRQVAGIGPTIARRVSQICREGD